MDFKLNVMEDVVRIPKIANVHFFEFPKGHETHQDKHPFCELIFVAGGHLTIRSDNYNGTLKKNGLLIHGANCTHSLLCPPDKETSVIIIGFECNSTKLADFSKKPIMLIEPQVKQLAAIVQEGRNVFAPPYNVPMYDMIKKKTQIFGSEQMLKTLLESFLIGLIRKQGFESNTEDKEESNFAISEMIDYVDANYAERITIDELAFLFRTNRSTLCKEFRQATGKTLNRYVTDKKVERAKRKLRGGNKTVTQIADELQFESVPYFCKFFKKETGMTPSEYQKSVE